ncbi:MAG: molybdopterin-guanine dinucleotide biosynthesis protein B [Alphaproteobacteria bacterium]|nr:molybdopterin-guanine dinucleotide biosynthesis protein B [Alphaproteobacteria bacterium]
MQLFGIAGWSGSGKTTLIERLIPTIRAAGVTVSTIKHAHHAAGFDKPGKDSYRHREAGAAEVLLVTSGGWALFHAGEADSSAPDLATLSARLAPVDLVLVEGFKHGDLPKLEVWRAATGQDLLAASDRRVVAVASDEPLALDDRPCLDLDDTGAIASFVLSHCGLG